MGHRGGPGKVAEGEVNIAAIELAEREKVSIASLIRRALVKLKGKRTAS
jgi:hypothetical protein